MASDLHIHTSFSDGQLSPEEILTEAKKAKLNYIAITDHDTIEGVRHLYEKNLYPSKTLNIIPGIEFSCQVDKIEVHVLGYDVDFYNQDLTEQVMRLNEGRWERFSKIIKKLNDLGFAITEADVLQTAGTTRSIGRAHIARVLYKKNLVSSIHDAFSSLLQPDKPAYVPRYRLQVSEAIELIHDAGGFAVLAHPKLIGDDKLVENLLSTEKFDGIEVFYPQHSKEDVAFYQSLAKKYNLHCTGGSDFHVPSNRDSDQLGSFTIDDCYAIPFFHPSKIFS